MQKLCHHIYNLIRNSTSSPLSASRKSVSELSAIYCLLATALSQWSLCLLSGPVSADHTMITARLIAPQHNLIGAPARLSQLLQSSELRNAAKMFQVLSSVELAISSFVPVSSVSLKLLGFYHDTFLLYLPLVPPWILKSWTFLPPSEIIAFLLIGVNKMHYCIR